MDQMFVLPATAPRSWRNTDMPPHLGITTSWGSTEYF